MHEDARTRQLNFRASMRDSRPELTPEEDRIKIGARGVSREVVIPASAAGAESATGSETSRGKEGAMGQDQFAVILPAAGKSSRFGDPKQKKIYAELDGRAVWLRAVEPFVNRDDVAQIIMAIAAEDREMFERRYRASVAFMNIKVIEGGADRTETVARALEFVTPECEYIAVHDAARPCLSHELVDAVFDAARAHGAALLAVRVADTIKRSRRRSSHNQARVPREQLYLAQTPQVFRRDLLLKAYAQQLTLERKRHRRLPARRGPGTAVRDRRGLGTQYQDHNPNRSQVGRSDSAALGTTEAPRRHASVLRCPGNVEHAPQAKTLGPLWGMT